MSGPTFVGREGGGEGPTAYYIDSEIPTASWLKAKFLRTHFDCKGRPFGRWITWKVPGGKNAQGGRQESFSGYGVLGGEPLENKDMMVDVRSIEMLQRTCCPPELLAEMLGGEGAPE